MGDNDLIINKFMIMPIQNLTLKLTLVIFLDMEKYASTPSVPQVGAIPKLFC